LTGRAGFDDEGCEGLVGNDARSEQFLVEGLKVAIEAADYIPVQTV
jgi:hypothetical protein